MKHNFGAKSEELEKKLGKELEQHAAGVRDRLDVGQGFEGHERGVIRK